MLIYTIYHHSYWILNSHHPGWQLALPVFFFFLLHLVLYDVVNCIILSTGLLSQCPWVAEPFRILRLNNRGHP